jgi:leukotriene-A4 hydrolase
MKDPHSFSNPDEAVVKHLTLNLSVDFEKKILSGTALLDVELKNNASQIILDTRDLNIEKVTLADGSEAKFTLGNEVKYMGRPLTIDLSHLKATPVSTLQPSSITIHYSTKPEAAALQWLEPSQTAGKKFPFLFTQSQAILARTWVPIQDSPGIRFTYSATIKAPKGMLAVMSAENPISLSPDGEYNFEMEQPVPAYLLALSVGNISFKETGSRTGVYAEPEVIDKAVY